MKLIEIGQLARFNGSPYAEGVFNLNTNQFEQLQYGTPALVVGYRPEASRQRYVCLVEDKLLSIDKHALIDFADTDCEKVLKYLKSQFQR